ncbi:MAG: DUF378 domain-containing protein [Myxococcales bacterium]
MGAFTKFLLVLAIIGAVNWGLIGFFNWNLVEAIFGGQGQTDAGGVSRIIYALVGLAGLAGLFLLPRLTERPHEPFHMRRRAEV